METYGVVVSSISRTFSVAEPHEVVHNIFVSVWIAAANCQEGSDNVEVSHQAVVLPRCFCH